MIQPDELKKNKPLLWSTGRCVDVWELFRACTTGDLETSKRLLEILQLLDHYSKTGALPPVSSAPASAMDAISGTWSGDMGRNDTFRYPLIMKLKFDGESAVSGTVTGPPLPGEINTGTFDPKTGALRLEVDVKEEGAVARFVFEGTVVKDTAVGRVSNNEDTGDFKITRQ